MDDFRRRYDEPARRDYGMPAQRPVQPEPPAHVPAPPHHHQPEHHPQPEHPEHHAQHPPHHPVHQPATARIDDFQSEPIQHHRPVAHHQPQPTEPSLVSRLATSRNLKIAAGVAVLLVAVFVFISHKPAKTAAVLPADLAKQASFSVYYPATLPAGFSYDKSISTFANNQAYYLLNKGTEHIVVREQAWSSAKLDTSSITSPVDLQIPIGKAAIGTNTGQTAAVVLAKTTLINMTSNGSVSVDEMTALINGLKDISQH